MFDLTKPSTRVALGVALAVPTMAALPSEAQAASTQANKTAARHCVTRVLSAAEMAAQVQSTITCYESFGLAMAAIGVAVPQGATSARVATAMLSEGDPVLAIHYTGAGGTGSDLTMYGTTCDGGGISFAAGDWWNDKISSTYNSSICSRVKHWVDANYSGANQITQPPGTLNNMNTTLNDQVSSMKYLAPA